MLCYITTFGHGNPGLTGLQKEPYSLPWEEQDMSLVSYLSWKNNQCNPGAVVYNEVCYIQTWRSTVTQRVAGYTKRQNTSIIGYSRLIWLTGAGGKFNCPRIIIYLF